MNIAKNFIKEVSKKNNRKMGEFKCNVCNEIFERRIDTAIDKEYLPCSRECSRIYSYGTMEDGTFKSKHPLWSRYSSMTQRCLNPLATQYCDYGGRGITVSNELKNFDNYVKYVSSLENAFDKGMTIDRIRNDENYEKGNLKWSDWSEQHTNKRRQERYISSEPGITFASTRRGNKKWMVRIDNKYIGYYETEKEAIKVSRKVQRLSRDGVHSSEWKQLASRPDDDIVRST